MFTKFEKKLLYIILLLTLAICSLLMGISFTTVYTENKYWLLIAGSFAVISSIELSRALSWFSKMNRDNRIVLKDD